jgi:carboxypeptidase C (cathepsin A)
VKILKLAGLFVVAAACLACSGQVHAERFAPLVQGDEPVVVTTHRIQTPNGPLAYEARAGRIPIRTDRTGEVRGHIFFVAYVKTNGPPRPITFAWNGGPLIASAIVHMEGLGPRRRTKAGMVDNPDTLMASTDLVFMDAVATGFSRPARPESVSDFMNFQGDVAATAEFIRAYRARFRAIEQPLFILGESYGVFRAAALADLMTQRCDALAGVILVSGDIPNIPQSPAFYDAMHVPARTATAFYYKRLDAALMRDREATMREATGWARNTYLPALEHIDQLSSQERDKIATELSSYIGMRADLINRGTLVVHAEQYLRTFLSEDGSMPLTDIDTRLRVGAEGDDLGNGPLVDRYIRGELGYSTDLNYAGLEKGYAPFPAPKLLTIGDQWQYNQPGMTPDVMRELRETGEVSPLARINPPWIVDALKRDKDLHVYVATGRYDPLNMCEGNVIATATLAPDLARRITNKCYESGHIIFRDDEARRPFLRDVSAFIESTRSPGGND